MNSLRLSTGLEIPLDGDLLAVLEALYHELTLKRQFKGSFEDMMREIESLVAQGKSLMPELVLSQITAQDAADLLAYLTTLK